MWKRRTYSRKRKGINNMSYLLNNYQEFPEPPNFLADGLLYETMMGSTVYGANVSPSADLDLYAFCLPPVQYVNPAAVGLVSGFDELPVFEQYQVQHVMVSGVGEVDLTVYNVVKYFKLCRDGNPNMLDSVFTKDKHVTYCSPKGKLVRDNRDLFLSKGSVTKTLGFASGELAAVKRSCNGKTTNRPKLVELYGYDTKSAYHVLRLLLQAKQLCETGTLELDRNGKYLQEVRQGKYILPEFLDLSQDLMVTCDKLLNTCDLPERDDKHRHLKLRELLLEVLH